MTTPEPANPPSTAPCPAFLADGGETGALLRAADWQRSALGSPQTWPQSLQSAVALALRSQQPMYVAWGPALNTLYNDAYIPICGARHPGGLGQPCSRLWEEAWDDMAPAVAAAMAGHAQWHESKTFRVAGQQGQDQRWISFSYTPLRDDAGQVAGFFCAAMETTEAVLAARQSAAERASFAQLFEQAPGFMAWLQGPQHRFETANPSYLRLVGQRDLIGKTVAEALPEALEQGYVALLDRVYSSGEPFTATAASLRLAGRPGQAAEERFVDFVYQPIKDAAGRVCGIFVEGVDVTTRARADAALRDSEARLRALNSELESRVIELSHARGRTWQLSPDLMGVLNTEARFEKCNPAWTAVLGWTADEVAAHPIFYFVHPADQAAARAAFDKLLRGEPILNVALRHRRKDGGWCWLSWVGMPEGDKFYCSARDITEQKQAQIELNDVQETLRQSQKMEAVGQLTGGVAHDFNNILQVISTNLFLIAKSAGKQDQGGAGNRLLERVAVAEGAVRRGAKLAEQLLAFGRRQALAPKVIHLGRLVAGMEELLRRSIGGAIEVETVVSGGLWNTLADPAQVENALLNLAINGRDAMGGSGKLTIEVSNAYLDDDYAARLADIRPGQYVLLAVTDTGAGMSPEIIDQAFEPFFSTKPAGAGSGLGLSMVYGFAKQSGGHVKIYSEVGQGSTIKLYLPRAQRDEDLLEPVPLVPPAGAASGGSETVLVVEDDEAVRASTVEMLANLGYSVLKAGDAASALTVIDSGVPIDLLFTDVVMPGPLKSTELARKARDRLPGIAVLFTSGYAQNAIVHGGRLDDGVELLAKPYSQDALAQRVRAVLLTRAVQNAAASAGFAPGHRPQVGLKMKKLTVLLVEDDELVRTSTAELIEDLGYTVVQSPNAEAAMHKLRDLPIDILVTDVGLPGRSGDVFAAEARGIQPFVRIVFATGRDSIPDLNGDGNTPVLLRKPFDIHAIEAALKAATS